MIRLFSRRPTSEGLTCPSSRREGRERRRRPRLRPRMGEARHGRRVLLLHPGGRPPARPGAARRRLPRRRPELIPSLKSARFTLQPRHQLDFSPPPAQPFLLTGLVHARLTKPDALFVMVNSSPLVAVAVIEYSVLLLVTALM